MSPFTEVCENEGGKMKLVKETRKAKHVDFQNLDAFETVSIGVVYVLSITAGVLIGGMYF